MVANHAWISYTVYGQPNWTGLNMDSDIDKIMWMATTHIWTGLNRLHTA